MSQSGDTPQQQGVIERFLAGLPDSDYAYWSSDEDRAWEAAFREECRVIWEAEEAADAQAAAAAAAQNSQLPDGPPIPAGLDLTEVFAAVPPAGLFDDDLREEFLYTNYLADNFLPDFFLPADGSPAADDPAETLSPFQRHQAQFVDRVLFFEKIIAWAQASKAEVLTEAWDYTTNSAETGRPLSGPGHEHDWDATFAAQQGLVAEMACAFASPRAPRLACSRRAGNW